MGIYQDDYIKETETGDVGYEPKKANLELLRKYSLETDISKDLDDEFLTRLADDLIEQVSADDETRTEWMEKYNKALDIAKQKIDPKEYPYDKASNVKIPLILQGCVQFNARVMPEIIQNNKTVNTTIMGQYTEDEAASAERLSNHMSLQTMEIVENWVSDTDKMLIALPLVGTVFRKWAYDPINRKPASFLCLPTEIIISNNVSSIEQAERITHVMRLNRNDIIERIKMGLFNEDCLDEIDLDDSGSVADVNYSPDDEDRELPSNVMKSRDSNLIWEVCTFIDLDDDGYCEPYTVTLMRETKKICRISARYDEKDFILNAQGELIRIKPKIYYCAHNFLPSPDGTFLGMGFGQMLLQLNSAINSITNQLIDAGTLANLQGGFLSRDLRIKQGEMQFAAGQWKVVNFNAGMGNLSNHIYPLPFKEPSQTLMSLLTFLVEFGKQIANINDIMMGNPVNANMPATSVVSMIEQGSKIFSSILTRLYESLRKEYNVLFEINKKYFSLYPEKDLMTKTGFVTDQDYTNQKFNIYPVANPALGLDAVRIAKMQVLMQLETPLINKQEVIKRYLVAMGIPEPEKVLTPPEQLAKPSPQDLLVEAQTEELKERSHEIGMRSAKILMDADIDIINARLKEIEQQINASYKGGQLAIGKGQAIAAISKSEAFGGETKKATDIVDTEQQKSEIKPDFAGVEQELGQESLRYQQISGNLGQPQGTPQQGAGAEGAPPAAASPQGQTIGEGQAPELPPELEQQLKDMAATQERK